MLWHKVQGAGGTGAPSGAWDLSYAYYDPPESLAWNLSTAVYAGKSFSVSFQESNPTGVFFKPDGTKMYVIGSSGDEVNEYDLSTAWDISTAHYLQRFDVSSEESIPQGLFFKPDGLKMYVVGSTGDDVNEYDLSTAWDISTASYSQRFSVASQEGTPTGVFFKPDGTKMYIVGTNGDDVNEYDLSTAWDISTASYLQNFSVSAQESAPQGLFFKPDGTKMYVIGSSGDDVNEYDLSTAWDVSTASYLQNFSVSAQDSGPLGLFFKPDGTAFYVVGNLNDTVYQYTLGGFSVAAQDGRPTGISFKPDGTKMYVCGPIDDVFEYDLSTAWDISTASVVGTYFPLLAEPEGVTFKPDGTVMYVVSSSSDDVRQYPLSPAWDSSTASSYTSFSVSAQEGTPHGLYISPDGTKMYVVGQQGDDVNEYSLSTAWDVTSASYVRNFSVVAQDTSPTGVFFKDDGTEMYVVGLSSDTIHQYTLSTAWNISTASLLQSFSVALQDVLPEDIFFKPDGTQMFVVGNFAARIYAYTLGPQP